MEPVTESVITTFDDACETLKHHFPGLTLCTPAGRPVPLQEIVDMLKQEGITVKVVGGRLRFRPVPSLSIRLAVPPWKEFLLHAHSAHVAGRLSPYACTRCGEITITTPTKRTRDRKKYTGGPDCRTTPGCTGRHDIPIQIPWAPTQRTRQRPGRSTRRVHRAVRRATPVDRESTR